MVVFLHSGYEPSWRVLYSLESDDKLIGNAVQKAISIAKARHHIGISNSSSIDRALCRIKLLPVTHVLVDTWMLTVKPVYKLLNVSDDLKWTTNTHVTPFSLAFKA